MLDVPVRNVGFASHLAVARIGLATASGRRQLASHPSGVRLFPTFSINRIKEPLGVPLFCMCRWEESNFRLIVMSDLF